ncbi:MAG TPA: hypothetical protein VGB82_24610 [Alphaproteobacteria bacterium]
MRVGKLRLGALCALALATALAGCNRGQPQPACPGGLIPSDAAKVTRFRDGPGRDLTDVMVEGQIQDVLVQCKYNKNIVDIDLQIAVLAARGPADRTRLADFQYFVAIVDPQQNILVKEPFKIRFEFSDNRTQLGKVEEISPRLPLPDPSKADTYRILVGFQLTPDELAWNRSQSQNGNESAKEQ